MYNKKCGGLKEVETDEKHKIKGNDCPLRTCRSSVFGWDSKHGNCWSTARTSWIWR